MSYTNLFKTYINPSSRCEDESIPISDKRLRWLKNEALGISKYSTTAFNVRHAHICNRNEQRNLVFKLECNATQHGRFCNELEKKQAKLWKTLTKGRFLPPIHRNITPDPHLPFSCVKEYTVLQHCEKTIASPSEKMYKCRNGRRVDLLRREKMRKDKSIVISTEAFISK